MKKYYLQAYLHLKTILTREIYGLEGHFFKDYNFVQNAIKNVIIKTSHLTIISYILYDITWVRMVILCLMDSILNC